LTQNSIKWVKKNKLILTNYIWNYNKLKLKKLKTKSLHYSLIQLIIMKMNHDGIYLKKLNPSLISKY
jgi:hypothetical protein